ncbi:hypothetical protein O3M35_011992 [Rhynocoris fuscipes]
MFLAYGSTATGKTYTMTNLRARYEHRGIIPRIIRDLYRKREELNEVAKISIYLSCLEFEGTIVRDLLKNEPNKISLKRDLAPMVKCGCEAEALRLIFDGESRRKYVKSFASCSTVVTTIHVNCLWLSKSNSYFSSKIQLVDMAGTESISSKARSDADQIASNMAMYSLNYVLANASTVNSLDDKATFARASPFTEFIGQTLLTGNIRLIAHVRLTEKYLLPTLTTLRLGANLKKLPAPELVYERKPNKFLVIQNLQDENSRLKEQLLLNELLKGEYRGEKVSQEEINHIVRVAEAYLHERIDEVPVMSVTHYSLILPLIRNIYKTDMNDLKRKEAMERAAEREAAITKKTRDIVETQRTSRPLKRVDSKGSKTKLFKSSSKSKVSTRSTGNMIQKRSTMSVRSTSSSNESPLRTPDKEPSYLYLDADDTVRDSLWQEFFRRYPELDRTLRQHRIQVLTALRNKEDASIKAVRLRCELDSALVRLEDAHWKRKATLGERIGPDGIEMQSELERNAELVVEELTKEYMSSRELAASTHAKYLDLVTMYNSFNESVRLEFQDYMNKIYTTTLILPEVDNEGIKLVSADGRTGEVIDQQLRTDVAHNEPETEEEQAMIYYEHLQRSHGKNSVHFRNK